MAEPTLLPERLQYRPTKIELDESIEKAKATLLKKIKRSVYVYRVDCGGCNGCEIEIFGSITPVFDVERFGIKVVPSPRHADVLLYTGAVTRAMRMPALRAFGIAISNGLKPSTTRMSGVTGSVVSLQSSPSHLRPSSDIPIWVWASIRPGIIYPPWAS